ncbi:metallophosphoesterase family protein [Ramlibacter rhizophilus]|uniref:Phosphoesterase n=1 Tax=Ramlibacter rhizophilus TaxID=1781167 RepID=A0A4Z0BZE8_9BURK|nr:metallophosphoesterase family protein [Ramlibacter rhizophilus]TFZ04351.1 metallophosphoesterase [Ramlibacter rhizophilus]
MQAQLTSLRVGLISDTHRLLRPQALDHLRGCDLIVHAGDLVTPDALQVLGELAPVKAVRGNNDRGDWALALPEVERFELGGVAFLVVHDLAALAIDPQREGVRVVVSGHSHKPRIEERGGVLFVNPGSAGPRRFSLPVALGEVCVSAGGQVAGRIITLT